MAFSYSKWANVQEKLTERVVFTNMSLVLSIGLVSGVIHLSEASFYPPMSMVPNVRNIIIVCIKSTLTRVCNLHNCSVDGIFYK